MRFLAYDLSLELIVALRSTLALVRRHDAGLAKQFREALASVPLNIAEVNGRCGGDRLHHFRIALGSLREAGAVLDTAVAFGWPFRSRPSATASAGCYSPSNGSSRTGGSLAGTQNLDCK